MDQIYWQKSSPFDFLHDDFFMDEILSRVDSAKSIVRLGMTSKRFQSLCSYPSVLKFKDVSDKNVGLIKYLDKFFESRMDSNFKYEFRQLLMGISENMDAPTTLNFVTVHLLRWFQKALSLNVQELIFHGEPFDSDFHNERPELNLQNSMIPSKHLRVLTLQNIPISINQSFGDWISNYCVSLEELCLFDVLVLPTKLTITSSSLRFFFIQGDFEELHVANAPKLEVLSVKWCHINLDKDEPHPFIKISDSPNLKKILVDNYSDGWVSSLRYGSSGDTNKFPSLESAWVLLEEISLISSSSSLERLLRDISQTIMLCVSDAVLHLISQEGMIQYANLFRVLRTLHVRIEGDKENKWWKNADTITPFAKSIHSLKTFKFTIVDYYDLQTPLEWLQNALSLDVRELNLQFRDDDNNNIINMKSYDYLKVPELKLQYSNPLKNVRILTLRDIPIGLNHSFEDWVSTSCVDLRVLKLYGVFVLPGKLTIASSSLRAFTIDAHFMDLHVSAPKLMALCVKWNLASCDETHKTKNLSLRVSNSPDLKVLWVSNLLTSLPLEYYNSSDDQSSFPSLKSSTVLIPEIHNNISLDSLKRLLVDTSQARKLFVSNSIIHKFRESLAENILKLGISSSLVHLDDHKVKIEVGPGDDETLILRHIIKNAPPHTRFEVYLLIS
ncbi:hypothetical protein K1719_014846 [Acacia pycnantha]|nr:hypothetical protein K1719_014846 [Acacia pycnantha]